jgi:hypothetical protein
MSDALAREALPPTLCAGTSDGRAVTVIATAEERVPHARGDEPEREAADAVGEPMFREIDAARDHQEYESSGEQRRDAMDGRREERDAQDVTARERVRERDVDRRDERDRAHAVVGRRRMRERELEDGLDRHRDEDEERHDRVRGAAPPPRDGETKGETERDLRQPEEPDDRADEVEHRVRELLRELERGLIERPDVYSASSKSSFERRKYQKPSTNTASATAAEYARRSHSGGRPSRSARWYATITAVIGFR